MNTLSAKSRTMNPKEAAGAGEGLASGAALLSLASNSSGITLIIPAFNEEDVIAQTLARLPEGIFDRSIVADNGSTDRTAEVARAAGAQVVRVERKGYGFACLAALDICQDDEVLAFLQADGSEDAAEASLLAAPILAGEADLVIGSRVLGEAADGALRPHQRFGNWLATSLIRLFWDHSYTDLGPFRAIRAGVLKHLQLTEGQYGWTVEMQIRALEAGLRVREVPVRYGLRLAGEEKVSGNWKASLVAGWTILRVVFARAARRLFSQ